MKFKEAKNKALVLLNEWTRDGVPVSEQDNADYLAAMPMLARMAEMEIARLQKIPARVTLNTEGDSYAYLKAVSVPEDYMELDRVVLIRDHDVLTDPYWLYGWIDRKTLAINPLAKGEWELHYFRLPDCVPLDGTEEEQDDYEFQTDPETHDLIPFFIASQLLMDENLSLATVKMNEYLMRVNELQTKPLYHGTESVRNVTGW